MERKYKAFISYRRLPLDTSIAKKLHRRLEHYVIPKDLRKNGEKRLGYVFRDQDELQASSDLPSSIRSALDNSEFLIVICTPDTKKSRWVQEEIRYFLEHHDHDHILAVLASGSPEESFPAGLTDVCNASGAVYKRYDPLAANVVSANLVKRNRLFRVESLRILASLLGCNYDELYQREQRYTIKRIGATVGVFALIAAAFIGVLLNRNAEIKTKYNQTLRRQSEHLATQSLQLLNDGDRFGAISLAIAALPSENMERPLVSRAEFALGTAVEAYLLDANGWIGTGALHHESEVLEFLVNNESKTLCTWTYESVLYAWDTESMQQRWKHQLGSYRGGILGFLTDDRVIAWTNNCVYCFECISGETIWQRSAAEISNFEWASISKVHLSIDANELVVLTYDGVYRLDGDHGTVLAAFPKPEITIHDTVMDSGVLRSCISPDGKQLAFSFSSDSENETGGVGVMDLTDGSLRSVYSNISAEEYYLLPEFVFIDADHLVFSLEVKPSNWMRLFETVVFVRSQCMLNCLNLDTNELEWQSRHDFSYPNIYEHLLLYKNPFDEALLAYSYSNHVDLVKPETGCIILTTEYLSPAIRIYVEDGDVIYFGEDGSCGLINPNESDTWASSRYYSNDLKAIEPQSGTFWVLQSNSVDVICYRHCKADDSWLPYETEWESSEMASSFYVQDSIVENGCFALKDDNTLLLSNGEPGSQLRVVSLPVDAVYPHGTEYTFGQCVDGILTGLWTDYTSQSYGVVHVDVETLVSERIEWKDSARKLQKIVGFDDDSNLYAVMTEPVIIEGKVTSYKISACVLDSNLHIVKSIPIVTETVQHTSCNVVADSVKNFLVYIPETEHCYRVDFIRNRAKECSQAFTAVLKHVIETGGNVEDDIIWSQDGSLLAAIISDNVTEVYRNNGELCCSITGETTRTYSLSFTPDGRKILVIENDGIMRCYRVKDGAMISRTSLYHYSPLYCDKPLWQFTDRGFLALHIGNYVNIISEEDWGVIAYVPFCYGYQEESDVFYCYTYVGNETQFGVFQRYSTESLIERGKSILNGWELSENQKLEYGLSEVP